MNPAISQLVSEPVYNGLLKDTPPAEKRKTSSYHPAPKHPALIVDTSNLGCFCLRDPSRSPIQGNILHALLDILIAHITGNVAAIITPYVLQGRLTNRLVLGLRPGNKIACSTVHRFQSSER